MALFSDDRMMTLATGLVLAIAVGTLVQNGDSLTAFFTGETVSTGQDDQYTVRAGKSQVLDVLANDRVEGELVILNPPACGRTILHDSGFVEYSNSEECSGDISFRYCVQTEDKCEPYTVALNVIRLEENTTTPAPAPVEPIEVAEADTTEAMPVSAPASTETTPTPAPEKTETEAAEPSTVASVDERFVPRQILVQEDANEVQISGFGADTGPSLFAPNIEEVVKPQETVEVLQRSVGALQANNTADEGIGTQVSAATPVASNVSVSQDPVIAAFDTSPTVQFSAPSRPSFGVPTGGLAVPQAPATPEPVVSSLAMQADTEPRISDIPPDVEIASPSIGEVDSATGSAPVVTAKVDPKTVVTARSLSESNSASSNADSVDTSSGQTGPIAVAASDPSDSSDIVVEMAAQIVLPGLQLGGDLERQNYVSPEAESQMTDTLFAPDLAISPPPSTDPVEEPTQVAALSTGTETLVGIPAADSRCDIIVNATARPGAVISMFATSPCRVGEVALIENGGLSFAQRFDASGAIHVNIPAMNEVSTVSLTTDDGAVAETRVIVRDARDMARMAVIWNADVDLDLHAFENGAGEGDRGHVWVKNARSYRETLTGGGGYLETFGDPTIIGATLAEVYTLPTNRLRRETSVALDLTVKGTATLCDESMILRTLSNYDGGEASLRSFNLAMPSCDSGTNAMILEDFVSEIVVSRR